MHSGPSESSRESAKMRDTLNTFLTTINALAKTCQGKPASADGGQERRDSRSGHLLNSILYTFHNQKDRCAKVRFEQNQGLCQLFLTVFSDLLA